MDHNEKLAIKIPKIRTSFKLYVNGKNLASAGVVGKDEDSMTAKYAPQVVFFDGLKGENEIVIQVSNFNQRSGGITDSIELGSEKQIVRFKHLALGRGIFLFASLFTVAIYNLSFYIFRRENKGFLYFGGLSFLLAIRALVIGENFFIYIFPNVSWEVMAKIQSSTFYLGAPLALMFIAELYPKYIDKTAVKITQVVAIIFSLLVIFTNPRFYSDFNFIYQILSLLLVLYLFYELLRISVNKEKNSGFIIFGVLALAFTFINDIVYQSIWTNDLGFGNKIFGNMFNRGELSSYGQFIFATTNSILLAKQFSMSLKNEEIMTEKLSKTNENLDKKVLERTKALEVSTKLINKQKFDLEEQNKELNYLSSKEPLTGLINRRTYDNVIIEKWNECINNEESFSLIFIDIDNFKLYNDTYGHMLGDAALIKVASAIKDSFLHLTHAIARYGGEEFIVLITDIDLKEIMIATKHFLNEVESLKIPNKNSLTSDYITVSIGVTSIVPTKEDSYDKLFETVDKAMYSSKSKGKNRITFFDN